MEHCKWGTWDNRPFVASLLKKINILLEIIINQAILESIDDIVHLETARVRAGQG